MDARKPREDSAIWVVDVGHGHTKFGVVGGPHFSFPSQVANAGEAAFSRVRSEVVCANDTRVVRVGNKQLVVGRDVSNVMRSGSETEVLDADFCDSDTYQALLFGALTYLCEPGKDAEVAILALGLPVTTFDARHARLAAKFTGELVLSDDDRRVRIHRTVVFPQPLGGYATFLEARGAQDFRVPTALIVDPGYGTVDWFVCRGMQVLTARCGDVKRGMGAVLRTMADAIIKDNAFDATPTETVRQLDRALRERNGLRMYGCEIDLARYEDAGASIIEEAANAIKNSIGSGADIDAIVMVGGGAERYARAIQEKFRSHSVHVLDEPAYANVNGYGLLARVLARSAKRVSA
jgi:plasmid segregation protein ParM